MKIVTNQVFLDGYDRFEADTEYDVDPGRGEYFCRNGWASSGEFTPTSIDAPKETEEVALEVHDVNQGTEVTNG